MIVVGVIEYFKLDTLANVAKWANCVTLNIAKQINQQQSDHDDNILT